jgi:hypothetical protein
MQFGGRVKQSLKSWTKILVETLAPLLLGIDRKIARALQRDILSNIY